MKGLMSNAAAKAWLAVVGIGLVVVLAVIVLSLIPRLGGGQDVIDGASPAMSEDQIAGERAGLDFISDYVELADPLMTARGGAAAEVPKLLALVAGRSGLSPRQVRAALRREAPHTEALLRALPLSAITREAPGLQSFLTQTLNLSSVQVEEALSESFPKLSETLAAIVPLGNAWNEIPRPFERFDGSPVRTVPELRDYLRDDLVAEVARHGEDFREAESKGGIGYIPWLLLIVGIAVLAFGLRQAILAKSSGPRSRRAWTVVVAVGIVLLGLIVVLSYFPRMSAADRVVDGLEPAFTQDRVEGVREGIELVHEAIRFGDPIVTATGGGAAEVPRLLKFISDRTGLSKGEILDRLRRRAPRTTAVLEVLPLKGVGDEVPHLLAYLAKRMRMSGNRLLLTLRKGAPGITQALENATAVTTSWNAIPGTADLKRFDGDSAVRTMPELDDYLRSDVIPVLSDQRDNFDRLTHTWPPLPYLPPLLLVIGALTLLYGLFGTFALASTE